MINDDRTTLEVNNDSDDYSKKTMFNMHSSSSDRMVSRWIVETHIYTYHSRKKTIIINYTEKLTGI